MRLASISTTRPYFESSFERPNHLWRPTVTITLQTGVLFRARPMKIPKTLLYDIDTYRGHLNACDPPEGLIDPHYEDIILQAIPTEYERICTSYLETSDFGITDILCMMSDIYAAELSHSCSSKGIAGRGTTMPTVEGDWSDIVCHYYKRSDHIKKISFHAKHKQQRKKWDKRNRQQH